MNRLDRDPSAEAQMPTSFSSPLSSFTLRTHKKERKVCDDTIKRRRVKLKMG